MYLYIYDAYIQDRRYEKELLRIENRLTDLGIAGKIARIGLFKRADEFIRDEIRRGATTVIAVGNDQTVQHILPVVADERAVAGLIPLGPQGQLPKLLGIPSGVEACDVLSARNVITVDMGRLNGKYFLCGVSLPSSHAELTCEGTYRLTPQGAGTIEVRNLVLDETAVPSTIANPQDGKLETVIRVAKGGTLFGKRQFHQTSLPVRSLAIQSAAPLRLLADGVPVEGTKFDITVQPASLRFITGKNRLF